MVYKVGRFLQFIGLLLLPAAVAGGMAERLSVKEELILAGIGAGFFFAGWLLQQMVRRP
jgi:hypothetical protein